jgi:hypothetical protein
VYTDLARIENARKAPRPRLSSLSESLRAREMLELLEQGRVAFARRKSPRDLVEREQDLRRRIAELSVPDGKVGTVSLRGSDPTAGRWGIRESLLPRHSRPIGEVLPGDPASGPPVMVRMLTQPSSGLERSRAPLGPDQALVEYP